MVCHEDLRSWKCKACGQAFNYKKLLQRHIQVALETINLDDSILICVSDHQAVHENERAYGCTFCEKRFNSKYDLKVNCSHSLTRETTLKTLLSVSFNYIITYLLLNQQVHVRLHTGEMPYPCPMTDCEAKYPAWSNLFKHCQSRHKLDIRSDGYKKLKATQKSQKGLEEYDTD